MAQPPFRAVIFDLDGTLTDPFEGIARSVAHALGRLGLPAPDDLALRAWIGPPLRDSFMAYLGDDDLAAQAVDLYRQRYGSLGLYENLLFPGIPALLADLRAAGVRLFVATSKLRAPAEAILAHFGLAPSFEAVAAPGPSDSAQKAELIAGLLPRLGADREGAVMVGDTTFDILGARAHGLPCIAVGYGYGDPADLAAAAPLAHAATVEELRARLLGTGGARP